MWILTREIMLLQEKMRSEQTYDFNDPAEVDRFREHIKKIIENNFFIDSNGNKIN